MSLHVSWVQKAGKSPSVLHPLINSSCTQDACLTLSLIGNFCQIKYFKATILFVQFFFPQSDQRTMSDSACRKHRCLFSWCQLMLPALPTSAHTFSFPPSPDSTALCSQHWGCSALTSTVRATCFASICGPSCHKCCTYFCSLLEEARQIKIPPQLHSALPAHWAVSFGSCSYLEKLAHSSHTS